MTVDGSDPGSDPGSGRLELLTVGRIGVDLYPQQSGVPLAEVTSFAKSLGGTATNVAVGAARLGHRTGVFTKVGPDGFGDYVRTALRGFGVEAGFVGTAPELLTPVVFCALDPPEDPPLLFYRLPVAPDLTLTKDDVPWDDVRDVPVFWVTGTGLSVEPSRSTHRSMLEHRGRPQPGSARWTVFDLDWRPMFWPSPQDARREYQEVLKYVSVAVGNRDEVEVAVATRNPQEAAARLLDAGVELALVKKGAEGVLVATAEGMTTVPPTPVDVVCGLGAGDAFGGALVHGLLSGWSPVHAARAANAAGALVAARLACADAMPTLAELEVLLSGGTAADLDGARPPDLAHPDLAR